MFPVAQVLKLDTFASVRPSVRMYGILLLFGLQGATYAVYTVLFLKEFFPSRAIEAVRSLGCKSSYDLILPEGNRRPLTRPAFQQTIQFVIVFVFAAFVGAAVLAEFAFRHRTLAESEGYWPSPLRLQD